jgi:predicted Fe-Mo cluster-binding NifX family protein
MKLAISSSGRDENSHVEKRFGRANWFFIVDTATGETKPLSNRQSVEALQGAGIQAAERVIEEGAEAVLTGHCGPKAFKVLTAAGIQVFTGLEGTIKDVLETFEGGTMVPSLSADVEGHWL